MKFRCDITIVSILLSTYSRNVVQYIQKITTHLEIDAALINVFHRAIVRNIDLTYAKSFIFLHLISVTSSAFRITETARSVIS